MADDEGFSDAQMQGISDEEMTGGPRQAAPAPSRDEGFSDAQMQGISDEEMTGLPAPEGKLMTAAREFAHNVIPGAVGAVAAGAGAVGGGAIGALAGGVGAPIGAVAGGVGGFMAGSSAAEAAQESFLQKMNLDDSKQREANRQANHYSALAGDIGGQMVAMSPGSVVKGVGNALVDRFGRPVAEAITRGGAGLAQAGVGAAGNAIQGEDQDAGDLALQFAAGALAPGFNRVGAKLNSVGESVGENIAARVGKVAGRPGETPNPGAAEAHDAVGDTTTATQAEDTNVEGNAFAETPPDDAGSTVGARDDNKPTNSQGQTATGKADGSYAKKPQAGDNSQVTQGAMDPATAAALKGDQANAAVQPQQAPAPAPAPQQAPVTAPVSKRQRPPKAQAAVDQSQDNGGFPKPGDAVATQEDVRPQQPTAAYTPVPGDRKMTLADQVKEARALNAKLKGNTLKDVAPGNVGAEAAAKKNYPLAADDVAPPAEKKGPKANPEEKSLLEQLEDARELNRKLKAGEAEEAAPAKPVAERAAVKDAIQKFEAAGEHEKAEALRNAPESAAANIKGARVRKNKGGVPIGDLKNELGEPVTANTKAAAAKNAATHEAVKNWFTKSHRDQAALDKETTAQTYARLAHHNYPAKGWVPTHKPREWLLAREARNVLSPTRTYDNTLGRRLTKAEQLQKFREDERILRHGSDAAVDEYRLAKQAEDKLKYAKGRGSEGVEKAEASGAVADRGTTEEGHLERMEREDKEWLGKNYKEGTFERVDPEAIAEGVVEKAVKTREDNKPRPEKTKDVTATVSEPKPTEEEIAAKKKADLEEGRARAKKNVSPEDIAKYTAAANAADKRVAEAGKGNELARLAREFKGSTSGSLNASKLAADAKAFAKRFLQIGSKLGANVSHRDSSFAHTLTPDELADHGQYKRDLQKRFHIVEQTNKAANTALQQAAEKMFEDSKEPTKAAKTAQQKRIFEARDADSAHVDLPGKQPGKTNLESLSAEDQRLYDTHLKDIFEENSLYKEGGDILAPHKEARDVENHIAHLSDGKTSEYNLLVNKDDPTGQRYNGLSVSASMANNRDYFALEDRTGRRYIIQQRDGGYNIWNNGKSMMVKDPKFEFEANKPYVYTDKNGVKKTYTMREAMASEKEQHARGLDGSAGMLKYQHNAGLSAFLTNSLMGQRFRNLKLLHEIMNEQEFKDLSTDKWKKAQDMGWEQSTFPNLRGSSGQPLYMDKKLKEVFDSYAKPGFDTPDVWRNLNHGITRLLFWMPTAHIANVGTHWFVGRGWDNVTPAGLHSLVVDGARAIKSVWNQDADQLRLMKAGAGLIYPGVNTRNFSQNLAKRVGTEMANGPKGVGWRRVADIIGVDPKALADKLYDWSSRAMWHANDVFLTQRIFELERKGLSTKQAIIHAERDIPNYQVPNRVMTTGQAGRYMSQLMTGNDVFTFGRYHYGMWNAYANMIKDTFGKNSSMADRVDGAGKMMAMGLLAFAVYPMLDKMAQVVTGNDKATETRRGPLSIPSHIMRAAQGKEDVMSALRSTFTVTPLISTAIETLTNHDFRGKNIVEPGDMNAAFGTGSPRQGRLRAAGKVAVQEGEHAARGMISPLGTVANAYKKNPDDAGSFGGAAKDVGRAIRDQAFDVKNPSLKGSQWEEKAEHLNERDSRLREKHGGNGPLEDIYNRVTR